MSGRILIADSVATNRIIMKVKLSAASYGVVQAETAASVLNSLEEDLPDLFIIDVDLPDLDGITLCRKIREDPATTDIPLIIVSTRTDSPTRLAALRAGADEFLPKPLDEMILLARVRNLIRSRALSEELKLREGTAARLGFAEPVTAFTRPERVLLVARRPDIALGWRRSIEGRVSAEIEVMPYEQLLDSTSKSREKPDLIVIPAGLKSGASGLILLAELRSRAETRHAAILVVHDDGDLFSAIAALDMGADDVLTASCDATEMSLRIRRQLDRKAQADRLRATVEDGLKLAMTDPLTGLFNRRYALPHLSRMAKRALAESRPFAVMVLDVDRFKRVNDRHGHAAGDAVLREIARRIKDKLRSVDLVARLGGEEFLVAMPDTDIDAARVAAERLRKVIENAPVMLQHLPSKGVAVTVSIGVAIGGTPDGTENVERLVDCADRALLWAKSGGRNQVTFGQSAA